MGVAVIDAEQRDAMRESFARLLATRCTEPDVRRIMATTDAHDPQLWREMAEMGVLATLAPEAYGGFAGGPLEIEQLMEEAGKVLLPGPFFSSAVLATSLLSLSTDEEAKARLLPQLTNGSLVGTATLTGEQGLWDGNDCEITVGGRGDEARLSGTASFVSDGMLAGLVLVVAGIGARRQLYEVTDRQGLTVTPLQSFDGTQRLARLRFAEVRARPVRGGNAAAIERALDLARVALAGRQAGAARRNFEFTVEYLRTRIQFGRPIGGFQAIKHMAADLLLESESALTAARYAAERLAAEADDATEMIAMASFAVNDSQVKIGFDSIQLHGGIGFTWEHPAHLYLRRARHDSLFLGSTQQARECFVAHLEKAT
jgi:alkylation response protein AidB-like acyl-CoA dehydrogenase